MSRQRRRRPPREQTREEILDAAARVFAERGFHGASVGAVSDEAGLSTGAVYSNFGGKEDLFLRLYEERIERRGRELRDVIAGSSDRRAGLAAAAATVDESLRQDRDFFLLYFEFALHAARNAEFARRFEGVRSEALSELASAVAAALGEAGNAEGVTPEQIARAIRALSYGFALDNLLDDEALDHAPVGRVLQALFAGLRAQA